MKCRPSGRNCGNRWLACPVSSRVTTTGSPPAAGTFERGLTPVGANKMVPSRFQAPPDPATALASTCGAPPTISTRFSLLSAKNPTEALSGDQNGYLAPSVPASGRAATESSGRTQSSDLPSFDAENTSRRPSGEMANESGSAVEGVLTSTRISGGAGDT